MVGFSLLVEMLRALAPLPDAEAERLRQALREVRLAPGARMSPRQIGYVAEGLLRAYHPCADGDERTMAFWGETSLSYSLGATRAVPGSAGDQLEDWTVEAVEPSRILTLPLESLDRLYGGHPCWNHIGRVFWQQAYREKMCRERAFLTLSATDRYRDFLREHRSVSERIPQYLAASYLGITPVALSRLRGRKPAPPATQR